MLEIARTDLRSRYVYSQADWRVRYRFLGAFSSALVV